MLVKKLLSSIKKRLKRFFTGRKLSQWEYGKEQPPSFYDEKFREAEHWKRHFTRSPYYPVWTVLVDRIRRSNVSSFLDLGCGSGQFASFLMEEGFSDYVGLDFSEERVAYARSICPDLEFYNSDVMDSNWIEDGSKEGVLAMEFLEHIDKDLQLLSRLQDGVRFWGTVPNYMAPAHVRTFENEDEVLDRYSSYFKWIEVTRIRRDPQRRCIFIIEAIR